TQLLNSSPSPSLLFSTETATTVIYTLSLHDALPIFERFRTIFNFFNRQRFFDSRRRFHRYVKLRTDQNRGIQVNLLVDGGHYARSEEHTSELQSRENLVCRLLLEKKKINITNQFLSK